MSEDKNIECERKFLIKYPDVDALRKKQGCRVLEISQTYLLCADGSMRVRKTVSDGSAEYFRNIKKRITDMSGYEDEKLISEETYSELLLCADSERKTIEKTRYAFPYLDHIIEVDVYPFWNDRAVFEVELGSEDEEFGIPSDLEIIKEVTSDKRYSNRALAKEIVTEDF